MDDAMIPVGSRQENTDATQHTPGRWNYHDYSEEFIIDCGDIFGAVILPVGNDFPREEQLANARLIAAAPDLLAALENVLPDLEHYVRTHGAGPDRRLELARAAIAKAKGG